MGFERIVNGFVLLIALMAGGCTWVGLHTPKDDGASTAEFRYEVEMIPNAELVRDNTSPDWQLGRYKFRRGADRLVVISRFTSSLQKLTEEELKAGKVPERYDWKLERVWITLPLGTPVGDELMLETLERDFLVGYDEGELIDGSYQMFRMPNKVLGRLTVLQEQPDALTVSLNMRVEPKRSPSWNFRNARLAVPVAVSGIHAKPTEATLKPVSYEKVLAAATEPSEVDGEAQGEEGEGAPAVAEAPTGQDEARSVVGHWEMQADVWEHRLQFTEDGRFIHASTRGIYPMIKEGRYTIRSGFVVMTYERYYERKETARIDHMEFLRKKVVALRPQWVGNDLVLHGELQAISGESSPFRFRPGNYADMRSVPMPNEKRPGFGPNVKRH